jgi:hypothetical protein
MSFWKNPRYQNFEETTREGDRLRGEVHRNFPWELLSTNHSDAEGDLWKITITCINVTPAKTGTDVLATIEAKAECQLPAERLRALGFSPSRMEWMGVSANNIICEKVSAEIKLKLEQLEFVAKANAKKYQTYLNNRYNSARKQEFIRSHVENRGFSRFSESRTQEVTAHEMIEETASMHIKPRF